jgi:hypothetical protein
MKNLHVSLCQMSYIIPIIYKLSKYFNIILYFVINKHTTRSTINLLELNKLVMNYKLITVNQEEFTNIFINIIKDDNIFFITSWNNIFNDTLQQDKKYMNFIITYSHGLDEEYIINNDFNKKKNPLSELKLNATLYDNYYNKIIEEIYKLDKNKKTIVFFETTSIWIFKKFADHEFYMNKYQENITNILIDLSNTYNIILRAHPQDYYGYVFTGRKHFTDKIKNNFITNYTQIPVFNLYNIADIIITSRFSASGYQALFIKDKPVIILETDIDKRKSCMNKKDDFLESYTNNMIEELKLENKIINNNHCYILYENNFDDIYNIIDKINIGIVCDRDKFLLDTFGIKSDSFDNWINTDILDTYL